MSDTRLLRSSRPHCALPLAERVIDGARVIEQANVLEILQLIRRISLAAALLPLVLGADLRAQRPRPAEPGRADSLLAQGRLAAAEQALYAAADAKPRDPAARGALAAYLASRGRFGIARVLFDEAQRFGADAGRVSRARAAILPYATAPAAGEEVTVPLTPARQPGTLGLIPLRSVRAAAATQLAAIDPNITGVVMGTDAAQRLEISRGRPLPELWIGERRVLRLSARIDSTYSPDEMRIGLDVLWGLQLLFDERAGTLTLGRSVGAESVAREIPWLLTFPGLLLVPEVGQAPLRIESAAGRALLRGRRWQIDTRAATIRVER